MDCIACKKEARVVTRFGKASSYICEHRGQSFSVRDNGQASPKEIKQLLKEQYNQVMKTGHYRAIRSILPIRGYVPQGTTPLYNPKQRR